IALRRWAPEVGFDVGSDPPAERPAGELYVVPPDPAPPAVVLSLQRLLAMEPRFVGLVGSSRPPGHPLEAQLRRGTAEERIPRVQSPVGLDIGARTPAEIALAILAGLVAIRRGAPAGWKDHGEPGHAAPPRTPG